jgi:hypothetical protein
MEGEGGACHLRQAPGLPAIAGRGVVGALESSRLLPIRRPLATVTITAQQSSPGGAGRIGTPSELDAGGRLRTMRGFLSRSNHGTTTIPCRAPAARRARGAERERAQAGRSGGASGPCRPGLKTYRKSSPPGMPECRSQTRSV